MGGQDGYTSDGLTYNEESNTLMAGFTLHPTEDFSFSMNITWTGSDAGIEPFDLSADDYVATHPSMAYDFSESHTYSDLDMTRIDFEMDGRYMLADDVWMSLRYRYAEFEDDAPYLYDTTGDFSMFTAALGWTF